MPGERIEDALQAAAVLGHDGINTILTQLGENLTDSQEAEAVTEHYHNLLDKIASAGLDAQISVKPTQLGLDQDPALCERNLNGLVNRAARRNNFVWIDMESSRYVDSTLKLFVKARERSDRIGIALQAYLFRTATDIDNLLPLAPTIRLVKGAYLEPPEIAYARKRDVDGNFYRLACHLLTESRQRPDALVHIATHDVALIDGVIRFINEHQVPARTYEFAMLYGIQRRQQQRLARDGRRLRVLISYGEHWFPWYMRRLAERPANALFLVKNLFS